MCDNTKYAINTILIFSGLTFSMYYLIKSHLEVFFTMLLKL